MYEPYADTEYYSNTYAGTLIPAEELPKRLKNASRHIDVLTYNRIVGKGILNLTNFQKETIKECCCSIADFEYENDDLIQSVLQSYSINGVSMQIGASWNLKVVSGVAVRMDIYKLLSQTGLCCPVLGVRM